MPSRNGPARSTKSSAKPTEELYRVEEILGEREGEKGTEILVRWAGIDETTGRAWPLDWIPKHWASRQTRLLWDQEKAVVATTDSAILPLSRTSADDHIPSSATQLLWSPASGQLAPLGVYVEVPPVNTDLSKENYAAVASATFQGSQSSSEPSRDTSSWRESTQQSLLGGSQLSVLLSQPSVATYPATDSQSESQVGVQASFSTARTHLERTSLFPNSDKEKSTPHSNSFTSEVINHPSNSFSSIPPAQPHPLLLSESDPTLHALQQTQTTSHHQQESTVPDREDSLISGSSRRVYTPEQESELVEESNDLLPSAALLGHQCHSQEDGESSIGSILSQISHNSQSRPLPHSQKESGLISNLSFNSNSLDSRSQSAQEFPLRPPSQFRNPIIPTMSSSLNGNSFVSPPMQDRVRIIRNSALSAQGRRGTVEDNSPISSRSTSVAPEPSKPKAASESRADSRPPEMSVPPQIDELFPEAEDDSDDSTTSKFELALPANGENMEFFLALPLPSRVKSQYDATIKYFKKPIRSFLSDNEDTETVSAMRRLVQRLNNVSTHVDLENEEWEKTQAEPAEDQTKWALSSGSKFVFLHSLCNMLRDQSVHIAVVAKQPRVLYILERFMQGIQIDYVRADSGKRTLPGNPQSRLKVSLIAAGSGAQLGPWSSTNLVVAFDGSFDSNETHIRTLRANSVSPGGLTPVVHPMVYCSAEHLARCVEELDSLKTELDRLKALIIAIDERQAETGEMIQEELRPDAAGDEVGHFVLNGGGKTNWTLLPVRPVKVPGLEVLLQDDFSPAPAAERTMPHLTSSPNSRKRPSEEYPDEEPEAQKRQRMSPIAELTHISESTLASQTAQVAELRQALEVAEASRQAAERTAATHIDRFEAVLAERDQTLSDQSKAMEDLQSRYEKTQRAMRKLQAEKKGLTEQVAAGSRRQEASTATIAQLRESSGKAVADLEAARAELATSNIPEVARLEQLRQENRRLQSERDTLERRAQSMAGDFEFTRQQYQQASSAAADHWSKIQELEQENAKLRQKASGEAVRLRELTNRNEVETHIAENTRLRAENEELKEQLKRKERGRGMTTRTGSVAPRSPRLGASPGRSRAGSRAPGSRPQSPVRNFYGPRRGRGLIEQSL